MTERERIARLKRAIRRAYRELRLEHVDHALDALDGALLLDAIEDEGEGRECGCVETYPQLQPGRLVHGLGCPLREEEEP